jgi:hypothetical protein
MARVACLLHALVLLLLHLSADAVSPRNIISYPFFSLRKQLGYSREVEWKGTEQKKKRVKDYNSKVLVLPPKWARFWYTVTALNPAISVVFNDYARMLEPFMFNKPPSSYLAKTYETLFFFARLKPRVSFAIGAILRALQLTTALQHVFDPSAGVGLGLNVICYLAHSRWPSVCVLGWSATKSMWLLLGASPPKSGVSVPIVISMHQHREKEAKNYRLGL